MRNKGRNCLSEDDYQDEADRYSLGMPATRKSLRSSTSADQLQPSQRELILDNGLSSPVLATPRKSSRSSAQRDMILHNQQPARRKSSQSPLSRDESQDEEDEHDSLLDTPRKSLRSSAIQLPAWQREMILDNEILSPRSLKEQLAFTTRQDTADMNARDIKRVGRPIHPSFFFKTLQGQDALAAGLHKNDKPLAAQPALRNSRNKKTAKVIKKKQISTKSSSTDSTTSLPRQLSSSSDSAPNQPKTVEATPKGEAVTPQDWTPSSEGDPSIQNKPKCPPCARYKRGPCFGGPPCGFCVERGLTIKECKSYNKLPHWRTLKKIRTGKHEDEGYKKESEG